MQVGRDFWLMDAHAESADSPTKPSTLLPRRPTLLGPAGLESSFEALGEMQPIEPIAPSLAGVEAVQLATALGHSLSHASLQSLEKALVDSRAETPASAGEGATGEDSDGRGAAVKRFTIDPSTQTIVIGQNAASAPADVCVDFLG